MSRHIPESVENKLISSKFHPVKIMYALNKPSNLLVHCTCILWTNSTHKFCHFSKTQAILCWKVCLWCNVDAHSYAFPAANSQIQLARYWRTCTGKYNCAALLKRIFWINLWLHGELSSCFFYTILLGMLPCWFYQYNFFQGTISIPSYLNEQIQTCSSKILCIKCI